MRTVAAVLAFAASALAYQVTSPNNSTGWTTSGPNTVTWTMVSTDPSNFTVVLSNQASFPPEQQILAALVQGSLGHLTVNPPSGGWKAGTGFQVNFVKDATDLDTILAQSNQFTITASSSSTFSSASSSAASSNVLLSSGSSSAPGTVTAPSNTGASATSGASTAALNPSTSDTSTTPANSNAASPAMGMQAGVWGVLAFLGAILA